MAQNGCIWVSSLLSVSADHPSINTHLTPSSYSRCHGWVPLRLLYTYRVMLINNVNRKAISCLISPWVCPSSHYFVYRPLPNTIPPGAPILSCVSKTVPGIFMDCHMMVAQPEKVCAKLCILNLLILTTPTLIPAIVSRSGLTILLMLGARCTASISKQLVNQIQFIDRLPADQL